MIGRLSTLRASEPAESCACTLSELFASRFSSLPADCGRDAEPGMDETEEWRHWVSRPTTPDQRRIETYLKTLRLEGKRILHVGVGNSGFSKIFSGKCEHIKGLTISDEELTHAKSLNIRNYECVKQNKYATHEIAERYDIIIDNNPTGFACCWHHFGYMIHKYCTILKNDGIILTDKVGLSWISGNQPANSRWSFDFQDWAAVARTQGLQCIAIDDFLIAWTYPGVRIPHIKHLVFQSFRKPVRLLLKAEGKIIEKLRTKLALALGRRGPARS